MNKYSIIRFHSIALLFLIFSSVLFAQEPTVSDCLGAIPVCDDIYFEEFSYTDNGNFDNELHEDCCVENEVNSVWYRFSPKNSGNLGFEIIPNNLEDDYDWAVFNITNFNCEDLANEFSALVSCNATGKDDECVGVTGANGGTIYNFQNLNCNTFPPTLDSDGYLPYNDFIPVIEGEVYVLLIVNFENSEEGYTLDFTVGDVVVSDNINPVVETFEPTLEGCQLEEIEIQFSELIFCNSFDVNDITITGPSNSSTISLTSSDCVDGQFSESFVLTFSPPLSEAGNYSFSINSDPLDLCLNPHLNFNFDYELAQSSTSDIEIDTILCEQTTLSIGGILDDVESYEWISGETSPTLSVSESGNYLQTVVFNCGDTLYREYIVIIESVPNVDNLNSITPNCESGGIIQVNNIDGPYEYTYSLDGVNFQNELFFDNIPAGEYIIYTKSTNDCVFEFPISVEEYESNISILLPDDMTINYGDTININAIINGNYDNFIWTADTSTMSCSNCLNFNAYPIFTSFYNLTVTDTLGCEVEDNFTIRVKNDKFYYAPNIFTPNEDGVNDLFIIYGDKQMINIAFLKIYDRWGELIFENNDILPGIEGEGWDGSFKGSKVSSGVYTYFAELEYQDGTSLQVSGTITAVF